MRSLWDISPSVSTRAPVFPGDTPFQVLWNERINDGGVANISTIHMSPHVGAHVDAPMHLDSGAVDVATLRLERFIGRCRVIDLSGADTTEPVSREELSSACFHERVLIKTRRTAPERWTEDFRSVSPGAVRMLLESGVMLIGLDTPSIDPAGSVYHPQYFVMLNNAMEDFFRECAGLSYEESLVEGYGFPIAGIRCDFCAPSRCGDDCVLRMWIESIGTTSVRFAMTIHAGDECRLACIETAVCAAREGDAVVKRPIPGEMRGRLEEYLKAPEVPELALRA